MFAIFIIFYIIIDFTSLHLVNLSENHRLIP